MQPEEPPAPRRSLILTDPATRLRFERDTAESAAYALRRQIRHLRDEVAAAPRRARAVLKAEIEQLDAKRAEHLARAEQLTAQLDELLRSA